ncbi:MAG: TetR/AcrR family transcriptional regulator [Leptothrix sp. (in: b-proteobacteria)]
MSNDTAAPRQKAPRRTAERILDVALDLFNRYGEPGTSTGMIAAELRISPGNLYYHYPAKETLVNALVERFDGAMQQALPRAAAVGSLDEASAFIGLLFEQIWQHRFLYRDLNDLLTRNRPLEQHHNRMRELQHAALSLLLERLQQAGALRPATAEQRARLATTLLLLLTYWLSHEYTSQPRSALEPDNQARAITRGVAQVRSLLELLRPC